MPGSNHKLPPDKAIELEVEEARREYLQAQFRMQHAFRLLVNSKAATEAAEPQGEQS